MNAQAKPQRVKITLQINNRDTHVLSVDFKEARDAGIILFKDKQYINTGMVYQLKPEEHDDPDVDWRGHLVFERAGKVVEVPETDEVAQPSGKKQSNSYEL